MTESHRREPTRIVQSLPCGATVITTEEYPVQGPPRIVHQVVCGAFGCNRARSSTTDGRYPVTPVAELHKQNIDLSNQTETSCNIAMADSRFN